MRKDVTCPGCGRVVESYRNPAPTTDVIVEMPEEGFVLIERKNAPIGWALPGGFVDYGESLEACAVREAKEEIGLEVALIHQLGSYSNPGRDARRHTITTVYVARPLSTGAPQAADDAARAGVFTRERLPDPLVFDHRLILEDYFLWREKRGAFLPRSIAPPGHSA